MSKPQNCMVGKTIGTTRVAETMQFRGKRGAPSSRTIAGTGRENTNVLMAVNGDGFKASPLIIFKARNMWDDWVAPLAESFPEITYVTTSDGWMESIIFLQYFEKSVLEVNWVSKEEWINHFQTITPFVAFIATSGHISAFKSLKVKWNTALIEWQRHNEERKIPKKKFGSLILDDIVFDESDDIEEEMREAEALDVCMHEISKPSEYLVKDDWGVAMPIWGMRNLSSEIGYYT
ncbi:hypothetical protein ILUMI_08927, partial [Ignelater luminosus]